MKAILRDCILVYFKLQWSIGFNGSIKDFHSPPLKLGAALFLPQSGENHLLRQTLRYSVARPACHTCIKPQQQQCGKASCKWKGDQEEWKEEVEHKHKEEEGESIREETKDGQRSSQV